MFLRSVVYKVFYIVLFMKCFYEVLCITCCLKSVAYVRRKRKTNIAEGTAVKRSSETKAPEQLVSTDIFIIYVQACSYVVCTVD